MNIRSVVVGTLLLGIPLNSSATESKSVDLKSIRSAIKNAGATWNAQETWLSELSLNELQRLMGLQRAPEGDLEFEGVSGRRAKEEPTAIDWRNKDGINWLGPVMNQGNCGSCVAFAAVATLEGQTSISAGIPWLNPSFSPQALFACGGGGCDFGWLLNGPSRYLSTTGVPDEACMPYTSGSTGEDVACSNKCADASERSFRIAGTSEPSRFGSGIDVVKEALKRGPLMTSMRVYADFITYTGGIYKHVTGNVLGGHAISLVGYDEEKRAWLIRNSWGQEWGDKGYAWISWDDRSGVGVDTIQYNVQPQTSFLSVSTPIDREYISGQYLMTARTQGIISSELSFRVTNAQGKTFGNYACVQKSGTCSAVLDTTRLPDGRYEVLIETAAGKLSSQRREFYLLNQEPQMSLELGAAAGVDLQKPLKGRPEFMIRATYFPVPVQHLQFIVLDSRGEVVVSRNNDYVLELMKMGWRTSNHPNGDYIIYLRGETNYNGKTYAVETPRIPVTITN